ncbi:tektin-1 isoform X2 [Brienomyrus brachyistius]|uniref:tektin-1 isoform X2 n=1 Tax=Brienomyrus brachyistius TaxID=42636 RepID=UPI0020B3FCD3|nr:tektin-1 isoform X2 [Brienomyrus brachyistius]
MSHLTKAAPKILPSEWHQANQVHYGNANAELSRSERLVAASKRLVEESDKAVQRMQQDANKRLEQRIQDIRFWRQELNLSLENMVLEVEGLLTLRTRLERALAGCSKPLEVTLQCLAEREKRVGIDLVHDEVERELKKQKEVIESVSALLQRTLEQTTEQIRLNRSMKYWLEKDLRHKFQAEQIDDHCCILSRSSAEPPPVEGPTTAPGATVMPKDWEFFSEQNIRKAEREKSSSASLRVLAESLLEQSGSDLRDAQQAVEAALERRVLETKAAKQLLEDRLSKVLEEMGSLETSMAALLGAIADKRAPMSVAQARLETRDRRPHVELCQDGAQAQLRSEVRELSGHVQRMSETLSLLKAELQGLTRRQLDLEEEIQVKAHSLYIDEVVCTRLWQSVVTHTF